MIDMTDYLRFKRDLITEDNNNDLVNSKNKYKSLERKYFSNRNRINKTLKLIEMMIEIDTDFIFVNSLIFNKLKVLLKKEYNLSDDDNNKLNNILNILNQYDLKTDYEKILDNLKWTQCELKKRNIPRSNWLCENAVDLNDFYANDFLVFMRLNENNGLFYINEDDQIKINKDIEPKYILSTINYMFDIYGDVVLNDERMLNVIYDYLMNVGIDDFKLKDIKYISMLKNTRNNYIDRTLIKDDIQESENTRKRY